MRAKAEIVAALLWLADDLEHRVGYGFAGTLRQLAGDVTHLDDQSKAPGSCGRCGGGVVQPPTGRRRRYCVSCSPRKTRGKRSNAA